MTWAEIEAGNIGLGAFFRKSEQYFLLNDNWDLWEEMMRRGFREQAIALANEGVYGLSAAVFAGTLEEAEAIGRRIDAGGISLNDGSLTANCHEAEKHSFKLSGMGGSRMGPAGYLRFFRKKALIRQSGAPLTIETIAEKNARPN